MLNIYIVSLKQDLERRKDISKKLESYGLKFSFIDAIYGKELSDNVLDSFINKSVGAVSERGYPATPGEVGCTLSHLKAYNDILDSNSSWTCILEDDVILDERFKTFINTFQDVGLDPKTLYLLGGQNGVSQQHVVKSIRNIIDIGDQVFTKIIKSDHLVFGSCCYLINSTLAKNFIQFSEKSFIVADDWHYLSKMSVVKYIYIADFVDHPLDLSASRIEQERKIGKSSNTLDYNNNSEKIPFVVKVKNAINSRLEWRLRLIWLNVYKHIERKDNI